MVIIQTSSCPYLVNETWSNSCDFACSRSVVSSHKFSLSYSKVSTNFLCLHSCKSTLFYFLMGNSRVGMAKKIVRVDLLRYERKNSLPVFFNCPGCKFNNSACRPSLAKCWKSCYFFLLNLFPVAHFLAHSFRICVSTGKVKNLRHLHFL